MKKTFKIISAVAMLLGVIGTGIGVTVAYFKTMKLNAAQYTDDNKTVSINYVDALPDISITPEVTIGEADVSNTTYQFVNDLVVSVKYKAEITGERETVQVTSYLSFLMDEIYNNCPFHVTDLDVVSTDKQQSFTSTVSTSTVAGAEHIVRRYNDTVSFEKTFTKEDSEVEFVYSISIISDENKFSSEGRKSYLSKYGSPAYKFELNYSAEFID